MFNYEREDSEIDQAILRHIKNDSHEPDITSSKAINFIVFNPNGDIIRVSNGFLELVGMKAEELEGQDISFVFFNPSDKEKFSSNYDEDEFSSGAIDLKHKSGGKIHTIFYNNYNSEMHMNLIFFIAA